MVVPILGDEDSGRSMLAGQLLAQLGGADRRALERALRDWEYLARWRWFASVAARFGSHHRLNSARGYDDHTVRVDVKIRHRRCHFVVGSKLGTSAVYQGAASRPCLSET